MNYDELATSEVVEKTIASLKERNFLPQVVGTKNDVLSLIKSLIPAGASVMNGASITLEEVGFVDYLKSGSHGWNNLHLAILAEKDRVKQSALRKQAVITDFYLGSVHAVTETGEMLIASNTGSQLAQLAFTAPNIILVVGAQKIVPTVDEGFNRIEQYVMPLEDKRLMERSNAHTTHAKTLILHRENSRIGRKVHVIVVNEKLGF